MGQAMKVNDQKVQCRVEIAAQSVFAICLRDRALRRGDDRSPRPLATGSAASSPSRTAWASTCSDISKASTQRRQPVKALFQMMGVLASSSVALVLSSVLICATVPVIVTDEVPLLLTVAPLVPSGRRPRRPDPAEARRRAAADRRRRYLPRAGEGDDRRGRVGRALRRRQARLQQGRPFIIIPAGGKAAPRNTS